MNIVYDDIIYSIQKSGGISVYWKKLEDSIPVTKTLVYKGRDKNIFYTKRDNEISFSSLIKLERYRNIRVNNKKMIFIFHSSYYRYCKNKNAKNITTVHDFIYEKFRKDLKSNIHKFQKKNSVLHSDGVICISENTKRDLYEYYPEFKGKVKVIYHGYDSSLYNFQGNAFEQRNKNVLFVGSRTGYKRFDLTVQLVRQLPELNLLIIGGGVLTKEEKDMLQTFIPNRYEKLNYLSNEDLAKLYNESFALFYPTEYEGFGFPVIEAQACGCPVVCQNKSSIPEVSGNKCVYIDSDKFDDSIMTIKKLFEKDYYMSIQNSGLENVKRFAWDKCIKETLDFYKEFVND